jgi:chemotaxis protein methyltransferase CheR
MTTPLYPDSLDTGFAFDADDFERVRRLIHRRAGIALHDGKQAMVYSRLSRRLRETGHRSFSSYLRWLESNPGAAGDAEWQAFVNCLTTNLTAFFREPHHFDALADELRRRPQHAWRLWCSAASTGEEAYSAAMVALEVLGPGRVTILASDIDTRVLEIAQRGVYDAGARGLDPARLQRHFLRGTGVNAGHVRLRPQTQSLVQWRRFNLVEPTWSLGEPFDIVLCRNVLIYFDRATQRRVLEQMHRVLRPGGLLFVGHSEHFSDARDLFRLRGKTIYARVP